MSTAELPKFDKYWHYSASVQAPNHQVRLLDQFYREARGGAEPRVLREDFCGTFANSCAWVLLGPERRAVGIDLDPEPLAYGCSGRRAWLRLPQQLRIRLIRENVLSPGLPKGDVIAALNFSYCVFKTRADLSAYFRNCLDGLEPDGILALDCLGGTDMRKANEASRPHPGFQYFFDQEGFDPVTHEAVFHIHYQREGEEKRRRVFTYDWRVWTVPELKEALLEAGFASVRTYWEILTREGRSTGDWHVAEREKQRPTWSMYVVALR